MFQAVIMIFVGWFLISIPVSFFVGALLSISKETDKK